MSDDNIIGSITRNEYCEIEQHHEIDWTIRDFFFSCTGQGIIHEIDWTNKFFKEYKSPTFSVPCSKWCFLLFLKDDSNSWRRQTDPPSSNEWIVIYLSSEDDADWTSSKIANFSFGVRKADGTVEIINEDITYEFGDGFSYSNQIRFLERWSLSKRSSELAPSGDLTITCRLRVNAIHNATSRLMDLSNSLQKLFISQTGCDAILKVQDEEFPVHKLLLASRSPVFEVMFEVDMKEKKTGIVEIGDCHPGAFKDFLLFVYSGKFENSSGDILELYRIAHKYCVERLKSVCAFYITRDLSVDNVVDVAILGHHFGDEGIKISSQDFFNENAENVFSTDKWVSLLRQNPTLANKLLISMMRNVEIKSKSPVS